MTEFEKEMIKRDLNIEYISFYEEQYNNIIEVVLGFKYERTQLYIQYTKNVDQNAKASEVYEQIKSKIKEYEEGKKVIYQDSHSHKIENTLILKIYSEGLAVQYDKLITNFERYTEEVKLYAFNYSNTKKDLSYSEVYAYCLNNFLKDIKKEGF